MLIASNHLNHIAARQRIFAKQAGRCYMRAHGPTVHLLLVWAWPPFGLVFHPRDAIIVAGWRHTEG